MIKLCRKCQQEKDVSEFYIQKKIWTLKDGRKKVYYYPRSDCKECWKKNHSKDKCSPERALRYRNNNPLKIRSRHFISHALEDGKIIKPKYCSLCNKKSKSIYAHHPDYTQPFYIIWVCLKCHHQIHRSENKIKNKPSQIGAEFIPFCQPALYFGKG